MGRSSRVYLGIDIASVDGNKPVDWDAASKAGCTFAIFRGAYQTWQDPTWTKESQRARDAGLVVGAYLFPVMSRSAPSARAQVAALRASMGKVQLGDLAPVLDVEFPGGISKTGRSRAQLLTWISDAVSEMQAQFRITPMIYTSARVWDGEDEDALDADRTTPETLTQCPLWLARYPYKTRISAVTDSATVASLALPPVPKAWGADNVWIHQYQGDALRYPGFSATEDMNRFFELARGAKGSRVKWVQARVSAAIDGDFGPATEALVRSYQQANGLPVSGIVDPRTFAYLSWVRI